MLGMAGFLIWYSWLISICLFTLIGIFAIVDALYTRRMAMERRADSICTFARSFNMRQVDPWVVRAVYEMYSRGFPLKEDDVLDAEELCFDIVDVAQRTGRSLEGAEQTPRFGQLSTAGDLVRFLSLQPRLAGYPASGRA